MTPRTLQIIAQLQQAQQASTTAANLLLQELAEMKAAQEQAAQQGKEKGNEDG